MGRVIERRQFLHGAAMGLAGLFTWGTTASGQMRGGGGGGMGGGGMGGGGSTIIDPPIGAPFRDPAVMPNVSKDPAVVEVYLKAQVASINVNGTSAKLMTYNGTFPGPTIRARTDQTLKIHFTNGLPNTTQRNLLGYRRNVTNLHTHGLHVSPEEPADFVMYELLPGRTYHHEYDLCMQTPGTLNFYHTHKHGVSAEQYWGGMMGALVVEDPTELPLTEYETHLMVLKDLTVVNGAPAPHAMMRDYMHGLEGNTVMVNGQVNPQVALQQGQVQRWRIVNASSARFYRLALQNHPLHLIGTDGGLLDRPYEVAELLLAPGERADLLVVGTQSSGSVKFQALPYARMGMSALQTITLLTVTYSGERVPAQALPDTVNPEATRLDPMSVMVTANRTLELSMGQGNGYINGQDFDVDPYTIMSDLGSYEVWTIVNNSGMDHPFHQHVNPSQILSIAGGDLGYADLHTSIPAWKDTVLVPKWGSVQVLVPVMDHAGMAMFHCHILEHEDIGMMGMWHIMETAMPMP
jgi:FtsP/CotA-like multicopper oxidase with cupredoxin domain